MTIKQKTQHKWGICFDSSFLIEYAELGRLLGKVLPERNLFSSIIYIDTSVANPDPESGVF
jgi:hypothetical protein